VQKLSRIPGYLSLAARLGENALLRGNKPTMHGAQYDNENSFVDNRVGIIMEEEVRHAYYDHRMFQTKKLTDHMDLYSH
jgi:hypothetical protein